MEEYLHTVLDRLRRRDEDDSILQCKVDHLDNIVDHAEDLLKLADQKLHVFPFKEIKSCWFRLYTDASIAKAVRSVLAKIQSADPTASATRDGELADEAVATLDRALIMAGGLGREDIIHEILRQLQEYLKHDENNSYHQPKRRKVDHKFETHPDSEGHLLPGEATSIPNIKSHVATLNKPGLNLFQRHMTDRKGPVVLHGILENWPALHLWKSTSYWYSRTLGGRRLVPVELGRSYVDDDWGQKLMPFKLFLQHHILRGGSDDTQKGYLAQHDLLKQIPSLYTAIATPDYCYLDAPPPEPGTPVALKQAKTEKTSHPTCLPIAADNPSEAADDRNSEEASEAKANIWFGPAWTISPLHHDPYHNILCQVVGKKYVRLYSPHISSNLLPRSSTEPAPHLHANTVPNTSATIDMSNTSSIDVAAMELSPDEDWDTTYPGISRVPYSECVLEAGQALYIPVGWWHYVRSCSVGISVSFWW